MAKQEEESKKLSETNIAEGKKFLEENKAKEGVVTTASGLQYKIITEGTGAKPKATDTVTVNYEGKLLDGTVFDSSAKHGQAATFPLDGVIPGWTEALQLMPQGSKWEIYIPSELAYGAGGQGPIPASATLIFEVELLEIKAPEAEAK
jgi:FKBP-type peptidyl-prolyl cis-trans isomerase FkpA